MNSDSLLNELRFQLKNAQGELRSSRTAQLARDLNHLRRACDQPCEIGFVGTSGAGKSSVLCALLGKRGDVGFQEASEGMPIRYFFATTDQPYYTVHYAGGVEKKTVPVGKIDSLKNKQEVIYLERGLNSPILQGMAFTENLTDAYLWNREETRRVPSVRVDGLVQIAKPSNLLNTGAGNSLVADLQYWLYPDGRVMNSLYLVTHPDGDGNAHTEEQRERFRHKALEANPNYFYNCLVVSVPLDMALTDIDGLQSTPLDLALRKLTKQNVEALISAPENFLSQLSKYNDLTPADSLAITELFHRFRADNDPGWSIFQVCLQMFHQQGMTPGKEWCKKLANLSMLREEISRLFVRRKTILRGYHIVIKAAELLREAEYHDYQNRLPELGRLRQTMDQMRRRYEFVNQLQDGIDALEQIKNARVREDKSILQELSIDWDTAAVDLSDLFTESMRDDSALLQGKANDTLRLAIEWNRRAWNSTLPWERTACQTAALCYRRLL